MGKVKTESIKHLAKELTKLYPSKFNTNFDDNKHMVDELTEGTTTRVRNQVAGYITRTVMLNQHSSIVEDDESEEDTEEE